MHLHPGVLAPVFGTLAHPVLHAFRGLGLYRVVHAQLLISLLVTSFLVLALNLLWFIVLRWLRHGLPT